MSEINKLINPIVEKAKKDKEILAVALFGSALKCENYRDIDICLFLNKKISNKEMTGIRIKYLGEANDKLDIQVFQQLPLYIQIRILKEGKILFVKDEDSLYELAFKTIKEFDLYEKVYEMYLDKIENG